MKTIYIFLITAFIAIMVYEGIKRLYQYSVILLDRIKIKRKRIANIDTLNNDVRNNHNNIDKTFKALTKIDARVDSVQGLAANFDRDMDRYHDRICNDNANFTKEYSKKVIGFDKALQAAFKRIDKLELAKLPPDIAFINFVDEKLEKLEKTLEVHHVSLRGLDDVQLIHAHSISKLEKGETK